MAYKNIEGQRFGRLVALKRVAVGKRGAWVCRCDCGETKTILLASLTTGNTKSCGCLQYEVAVKNAAAKTEDITGKSYNRLTVISKSNTKNKKGNYDWLCRCECGNILEVPSYNLRHGITKSCGCLSLELKNNFGVSRKINLINKTIGRLTVLKETDVRSSSGSIMYLCQCECGNKKLVSAYSLNLKGTKSCGCLQRENVVIKGLEVKGKTDFIENGTSLSAMTKKIQRNNTSGYPGISYSKKSNRWSSRIKYKSKEYYLGSFTSFQEAYLARKKGEEKYFLPILRKYGKER